MCKFFPLLEIRYCLFSFLFQAETAQQTASEKFEHISEVAKQGNYFQS